MNWVGPAQSPAVTFAPEQTHRFASMQSQDVPSGHTPPSGGVGGVPPLPAPPEPRSGVPPEPKPPAENGGAAPAPTNVAPAEPEDDTPPEPMCDTSPPVVAAPPLLGSEDPVDPTCTPPQPELDSTAPIETIA